MVKSQWQTTPSRSAALAERRPRRSLSDFLNSLPSRKRTYLVWIAVGTLLLWAVGCSSAPTPSATSPGTAGAPSVTEAAPSVTAVAPTVIAPTTIAPMSAPATSASPGGAPTIAAASPSAAPSKTAAAGAPANAGDWTMYHYDSTRTGYVPDMPDPTHLAIAWNTPLDGAVYAEPLVIGGHVIVATEGDSVYSLDAQTGKILWRTNLGQPATRAELPCGDINPLGITGTPIYDPATGLVFLVAEVTGPAHFLAGIDAATGQVRVKRSADLPGMEPAPYQQRAALALGQGMVYLAYGGLYGDCGNYRGTVIGSRTDGSGPLFSFQVPTPREGGIWAPPGPAIDGAGNLFVSVGNGAEITGSWDHSDSVLRLSPTLQLEDGFAPDQWRQDNVTDADLGSLGPVLLPGGFVFIMGKAGIGYVLHANALGGVGGQVSTQSICHAYGGAAVVGSTVFVPCTEGVQQIQIGANGSLNVGWQARGITGSPVVGGHTVYTLDRSGTLYALDAASGRVRAQVGVGEVTRFATPALSHDRARSADP